MKVAVIQSLIINTTSTCTSLSHSSHVTQLHYIYTVRARAPDKETETSNKEVSLSFASCYYMVVAFIDC